MNEFIVSTDLYETSDANVYTSYHLARLLGKRPKLYYVDIVSPMIDKIFHPSSIHTSYVTDSVWLKEFELTVLKKISQQLGRLLLKKEDFDFDVFEGSVSEGIHNLKKNADFSLISVGASDHSELYRLFFNTFTEKVFFNLGKETLVVKKKDNHFSNIYLLLNPQENHGSKDRIITRTAELIKKLKSKLHIICIANAEFLGLSLEAFPDGLTPEELQNKTTERLYEKTEEFLKQLEVRFNKEGIDVEHMAQVTLNEESAPILNQILQERTPDLVIMSPRSHFLGHFSLDSITHYMIKRNDCNFYLIP